MTHKVISTTIIAALTVLLQVSGCSDSTEPATPVIEPEAVKEPMLVGEIDDERILNHLSEPGNWLAHGRTYEEQRFSPLTQVNKETISELGLAWYLDMGTNRAQEATPIVADGIMFVSSAWSRVFAIKASSGEVLWKYDPLVPKEWSRRACCDAVNRGVAVYKGRVYVGSLDGRLIALDAATGKEIWQVDTLIDRDRFYTITGAPRVANGKVFIGNGGAEFGVRGYVTAYDAESGKQAWRFFTVPGDPALPYEHPALELAATTWSGSEWWKFGGGGTVWNSIVYDPEYNQLYIGVGNGSPWTRAIRSPGGGDNLFLSSIVALDADSGAMKWYYQTTPGDNWDYTAVQDIALADMEVDGEMRKVLMQAPKNGFFYVLNRSDGKLLRAHPYSLVTWASHVDMESGRPVENSAFDYLEKEKWVLPGSAGAHNWQAMSVDVDAGVVYIPTQESSLIFAIADEWKQTGMYKRDPGRWNNGLEMGRLAQLFIDNISDQPTPGGALKAFDPLTGKTKWTIRNPYYWNGGVLATSGGLVFQGDAAGMFTAYDKENGELLWQFNTYTSMLAPPVSFEIDNVQYVSILTGGGGADLFGGETDTASTKYGNYGRLLVFKLGGNAELPLATVVDRIIPQQVLADVDEKEIANGEALFNNYCAMCHGLLARSGGSIPDLRLLIPGRHEIFNQIVLDGLLSANGMAAFKDVLSEKEVETIHHYIRARAHEDRQVALGNKEHAKLTWLSNK
jgi:quinohemoprotein ethanol dehydrogenase